MDHGGKNIIQGKIFIKFKKDIWPKNMHQVILKSKICNEYWRPTSNIFHGNFIYNGLSNLIQYKLGENNADIYQALANQSKFLKFSRTYKMFFQIKTFSPFFWIISL